MEYSKSISIFLLVLGLFSLAMNFYMNSNESYRRPSSVMVESENAANTTPPWWITY